MKVVTVGDVHGRTVWKKVDPTKYDKVIFTGDYLDSYVHTDYELLSNLSDIIALKKAHPDIVELCLGNHDLHYLYLHNSKVFDWVRCSGFRMTACESFSALLNENKELFHGAYQIKDYLWSHAGLSFGYYRVYLEPIVQDMEGTMADKINKLLKEEYEGIFAVGPRRGGYYQFGGPFWADRQETNNSPLTGYHQIVGHTPLKEIETRKYDKGQTSITYVDVGGHGNVEDHPLYELTIED